MVKVATKLAAIQAKLFVPKGQKNQFGGFNYRSCEDILKEVKPLIHENKCALFLSNRIVHDGERTYVEAEATLVDIESGEHLTVTAQAREPAVKKGMDESQITGASMSYARKYALAGLFCIDNEKDPDTYDNRNEGTKPQVKAAREVVPPKVKPRKAAVVWAAFKALPENTDGNDDEIKQRFIDLVKEITGKTSSNDVTNDEWDKVSDAFAVLSE